MLAVDVQGIQACGYVRFEGVSEAVIGIAECEMVPLRLGSAPPMRSSPQGWDSPKGLPEISPHIYAVRHVPLGLIPTIGSYPLLHSEGLTGG
jgi:hypothetical protein